MDANKEMNKSIKIQTQFNKARDEEHYNPVCVVCTMFGHPLSQAKMLPSYGQYRLL